jgi:predicted DsbA family dithiol-disulfide isomerase
VGVAEALSIDVYYDYLCPFVYRASVLLDAVQRSGKRDIEVRWRYFSLTQVNSKDDGWRVWAAPASEPVKGRLAFAAAEAARRQRRFDEFHRALLVARHRDRLDIDSAGVIEKVAAAAGLDIEALRRDIADPAILARLASDHTQAVSELGVFGTPTLVFGDGTSAYVRLAEAVDGEDATEVFARLVAVAASEPRILEIKRPHKAT